MSDEQDIPYVKFLSAEVVTPVVNGETGGVWARYEVVNLGTAPTTSEIDVSWGICFKGAVMKDGVHKFDTPIEANGGSYQGTIHFYPEAMPFPGDWELSIQVDVGMNKGISDSVSLPFTVEESVHAG